MLFVIEGSGSTDIDGDLITLPIRPGGATYQHFNNSDEPAFLFACEPNLAFIFDLDRGSSFEELENAPEFADESAAKNLANNPPMF